MSVKAHNQRMRVLDALKRRKIANHDFSSMYILSHTKVISDLRAMGHNIVKERVYKNGKATRTFLYYIPKPRKPASKAMEYEETPIKSNWLIKRLKGL